VRCCAGSGKLDRVAQCSADVIGLDWHTDMADARRQLGADRVLQGNMDPMLLFAPEVLFKPFYHSACCQWRLHANRRRAKTIKYPEVGLPLGAQSKAYCACRSRAFYIYPSNY
jgi:hypothetical protein